MSVLKNDKGSLARVEGLVFAFLGIALMAYSLIEHYSRDNILWKMSPYLFPLFTAILFFLLGISRFFQGKRECLDASKEKMDSRTLWSSLGILVLYCTAMPIFGFIFSTLFFLAVFFRFLGEIRWWLIGILSGSVTFVLYFVFGVLLHVMLP